MQFEIIFGIVALIFSVVLHEVSHGYMANFLGDPTARLEGRLTLNPLKHLDPFGSFFLPLILVLTQSPILFGWAKPVPYNPYNLRRGGMWAEALVAGAGPASNLLIAISVALFLRVGAASGLIYDTTLQLGLTIVFINIMLALFNMLPVPPLDGSKILSAILPRSLASVWEPLRARLEYSPFLGFGIVIIFIMILGSGLGGLVQSIARVLVGV